MGRKSGCGILLFLKTVYYFGRLLRPGKLNETERMVYTCKAGPGTSAIIGMEMHILYQRSRILLITMSVSSSDCGAAPRNDFRSFKITSIRSPVE